MKAKPRVAVILPGFIPSTVTLVVKPLLALHRRGLIQADITLEKVATANQVLRADAVVFCRNVEPGYQRFLELAQKMRHPIIYDLDDNFFDVPLDADQGPYLREPARLRQLETYLASATLVRVYSPRLRERVAALNSNSEVVTSPFDWSLVPATPPTHPSGGKLKLVYATSRVRDNLAQIFLGDMARLLDDYARRVEMHFWGYRPPEFLGHPAVHGVDLIADYNHYIRRFYASGYEIGLAPMLDDDFHRSKTNTKFREYGACGVAGIYSDVEVYATCVEHGVTGWLTQNQPGAWYAALARLIEDRPLREHIQLQAWRQVRERHSMEAFEQGWWMHLRRVLAEGGPSRAVGYFAARSPLSIPIRSAWTRLQAHTPAVWCHMLRALLYDLWMLVKVRWVISSPRGWWPRRQMDGENRN